VVLRRRGRRRRPRRVGPGLVALALSSAANLVFFAPVDPRITAYVVVSSVIVVLFGLLHRARDRAESARQREIEAREASEQERERAAFLADGNVVLSASLDYQETLAALAALVVPRLADWCAVDVVEPDGTVRRAAVTHGERVKADLARETAVYEPDPESRHPRTEVLRTGKAQLFTTVDDDLLAAIAANPHHLRVMREMGYVSAMIVPLVARGRTLGAITCATTHSGRRYGPDDLALAENVAMRAAIAVDNARLYREAEVARAEAEEANRAKDQFLSVVSHELKTPLAATLGWLRVLRSGSAEHATRALDTIERSMNVQAQLIDDLLDVSRIVSGRLRLDLGEVDLPQVIAGAVDMIRPDAAAKDVRLEIALASVDPIVGDPDRVRQIAWNLLSNAVKFTDAGGLVALQLSQAGDRVRIVVRDTGKGISADFLPHVFERFRQAEPVSGRDKGGLGLGLAIVQHLVELHGGAISVASEGEGRGATFTVVLPAAVDTLAGIGTPPAVAPRPLDRGPRAD
jgi:signal transduction histidine kinase